MIKIERQRRNLIISLILTAYTIGIGQQIDMQSTIKLDTQENSIHVAATYNLPKEIKWNSDTIWFYSPLLAESSILKDYTTDILPIVGRNKYLGINKFDYKIAQYNATINGQNVEVDQRYASSGYLFLIYLKSKKRLQTIQLDYDIAMIGDESLLRSKRYIYSLAHLTATPSDSREIQLGEELNSTGEITYLHQMTWYLPENYVNYYGDSIVASKFVIQTNKVGREDLHIIKDDYNKQVGRIIPFRQLQLMGKKVIFNTKEQLVSHLKNIDAILVKDLGLQPFNFAGQKIYLPYPYNSLKKEGEKLFDKSSGAVVSKDIYLFVIARLKEIEQFTAGHDENRVAAIANYYTNHYCGLKNIQYQPHREVGKKYTEYLLYHSHDFFNAENQDLYLGFLAYQCAQLMHINYLATIMTDEQRSKFFKDLMLNKIVTFDDITMKKYLIQEFDAPLHDEYEQYSSLTKPIDIGLDSILVTENEVRYKVVSHSQEFVTMIIRIHSNKEIVDNKIKGLGWVTIPIQKGSNVEKILLDPDNVLPKTEVGNVEYSCKIVGEDESIKKTTDASILAKYFALVPAYNDNNNFMVGTIIHLRKNQYNGLSWQLAPFIGFKKLALVGTSVMNYIQAVGAKSICKIDYQLLVKSFHFNNNKVIDYSQRYISVDPSITLHFTPKNYRTAQSMLRAKADLIWEQMPIFSNDGKYGGLSWVNSKIYTLTYVSKKRELSSSSGFRSELEYQNYSSLSDDEYYVKASASYTYEFSYTCNRKIYSRFFGAGFLANTQRASSSYQNIFTRGSIAMIYQGFNDYKYDYTYLSRANQNRLYDNQIRVDEGGGFKTPIGSAYGAFMSNNYAFAVNLAVDLFKIPVIDIHVQAFGDAGVYSTFEDNSYLRNTLYSMGLSIHIRDVLSLNLPLLNSSSLQQIYKSQHPNVWGRISFYLELNRSNYSDKYMLY